MGSRTSEALKRSQEARARLDATLGELERRAPSLRAARTTIAVVTGSGFLSAVVLRALRSSRRRARAADAAAGGTAVSVTLVPGPAALAAALVWAGVRVYELQTQRAAKPAAVRALRPDRSA